MQGVKLPHLPWLFLMPSHIRAFLEPLRNGQSQNTPLIFNTLYAAHFPLSLQLTCSSCGPRHPASPTSLLPFGDGKLRREVHVETQRVKRHAAGGLLWFQGRLNRSKWSRDRAQKAPVHAAEEVRSPAKSSLVSKACWSSGTLPPSQLSYSTREPSSAHPSRELGFLTRALSRTCVACSLLAGLKKGSYLPCFPRRSDQPRGLARALSAPISAACPPARERSPHVWTRPEQPLG